MVDMLLAVPSMELSIYLIWLPGNFYIHLKVRVKLRSHWSSFVLSVFIDENAAARSYCSIFK